MFLAFDDTTELPAGTHGLYSNATCTDRVGVLDVNPDAGFEKWFWESGHDFAYYQGDNDRWFFLKIAANPAKPWPGALHHYPDEELPAGKEPVVLDGEYLEMVLQGATPQPVGWLRWRPDTGPNGANELEWFVLPPHRDGTTKRINLSPGQVLQLRQPSNSASPPLVHRLKCTRMP